MEPGVVGLILALLAGLSTSIGASVVFFLNEYQVLPFTICMSASASVMIYVSFVEMFPQALAHFEEGLLAQGYSEKQSKSFGYLYTTLTFLCGWLLTTIFDKIVHEVLHRYAGLETVNLDSLKSEEEVKNNNPENFQRQTSMQHDDDEAGGDWCERGQIECVEVARGEATSARVESDHERDATLDGQGELHCPRNGEERAVGAHGALPTEEINEYMQQTSHQQDYYHTERERLPTPLSTDCELTSMSSKVCNGEGSAVGLSAGDSSTEAARKSTRGIFKKILLRSETTESEKLAIAFAEEQFKRQTGSFTQLGLIAGAALFAHNFPEGLATLTATLADVYIGFGIALAIAIHNIPEGFCVAVPIYFGTGSKWKGFWYSVLSGIAEPIGALIAYFALGDTKDPIVFGVLFALISGVMCNISFKGLLPTAIRYDPTNRAVTLSFFIAMTLMASSLVAFKFVEN